jgi:exonuclease III
MEREKDVRGKFALEMYESGLVALIETQAMFEILEADIVIFQETKIQRKDLQDDMVLVPGWDCFFSLPKHKKGR